MVRRGPRRAHRRPTGDRRPQCLPGAGRGHGHQPAADDGGRRGGGHRGPFRHGRDARGPGLGLPDGGAGQLRRDPQPAAPRPGGGPGPPRGGRSRRPQGRAAPERHLRLRRGVRARRGHAADGGPGGGRGRPGGRPRRRGPQRAGRRGGLPGPHAGPAPGPEGRRSRRRRRTWLVRAPRGTGAGGDRIRAGPGAGDARAARPQRPGSGPGGRQRGVRLRGAVPAPGLLRRRGRGPEGTAARPRRLPGGRRRRRALQRACPRERRRRGARGGGRRRAAVPRLRDPVRGPARCRAGVAGPDVATARPGRRRRRPRRRPGGAVPGGRRAGRRRRSDEQPVHR